MQSVVFLLQKNRLFNKLYNYINKAKLLETALTGFV